MSSDSPTTDQRALSPRANIALLSLRLRAAVREAETVEAEAEHFDTEAALAELRSNLQPRFEERKAAMVQELATAKREATYELAAAHRESARSIAEARARADERARAAAAVVAAAEAVVADEAEAIDESNVVEEVEVDVAAAVEVVEPEVTPEPLDVVLDHPSDQPAAFVLWPTDDLAPEHDEWAPPTLVELPAIVTAEPAEAVHFREFSRTTDIPPPPLAPWGPPQTPMQVVVDADAFARVFAAVLAASIAERGPAQQPMQPMYLPYPAPQQKTSFWSNAKHIDVLLLFLAMVIVVVILIAWLA